MVDCELSSLAVILTPLPLTDEVDMEVLWGEPSVAVESFVFLHLAGGQRRTLLRQRRNTLVLEKLLFQMRANEGLNAPVQ